MSDLPPLLQYVKSLGYDVFVDGLYNLNLIGMRRRNGTPDAFDDIMVAAYKDEDGWVMRWWPITTDPGLYYLLSADKQLNPLGTAVLVPGQYKGVYGFGLHGSTQYEALTQQYGKVQVYRDGNYDSVIDCDAITMQEGYFGINIHASDSSPYSGDRERDKVGAWSAGCQVFKSESNFRSFMALCHRQVEYHPSWVRFTYTLVVEPDGWVVS